MVEIYWDDLTPAAKQRLNTQINDEEFDGISAIGFVSPEWENAEEEIDFEDFFEEDYDEQSS